MQSVTDTSMSRSMAMVVTMGRKTSHSEELERELGQRIRSVRIDAGFSQVELADRANVSLGAVKNLERGAGSTVTTLLKVLRALGRTDWLTSLAAPPAVFNPLDVLAVQRRSQEEKPPGPPRVRRRALPAGAAPHR